MAAWRAARRHQVEADVAQRTPPGAGGVRRIAAGHGHALVGRFQRGIEHGADLDTQRLAGAEDGVGIDVLADLAGDVAFAGRHQRQRDEGRLQRGILQDRGQRPHQLVVVARSFMRAQGVDVVDQQAHGDGLQRLPAVERIAVVGGEEGEIVGGEVGDELDRRRRSRG